jgi:hypothetical protein
MDHVPPPDGSNVKFDGDDDDDDDVDCYEAVKMRAVVVAGSRDGWKL